MGSSYKIVIARYNETLEWTNKLNENNIIIYNKGDFIDNTNIHLKNIGREGETFLYHIINNYNELPDYLILLQGDPFCHMTNITPDNFQDNIDKLIKSNIHDIQPLFTHIHIENHYKFYSIKSKEYYSLIFDENIPIQLNFAAGSQYIIPKKNILNRTKNFYIKLKEMLYNSKIIHVNDSCYGTHEFDCNTIDGWTLERLIMYVFKTDIKINTTYFT